MLKIDAVRGAIVQQRNDSMWYLMLVTGMKFEARTEAIYSRIPRYVIGRIGIAGQHSLANEHTP
jgi:hypothetical protein